MIAGHGADNMVVMSYSCEPGRDDRMANARTIAIAGAGGIVPFNVVRSADGKAPLHVHRASDGKTMIGEGVAGLADLLDVEGLAVETHGDMNAVLWSKLLMNLNNALVA